jgi:hypothetical protein
VFEIELHDEVSRWIETLTDEERDRTVLVVDRLAADGFSAQMPHSRALGESRFEFARNDISSGYLQFHLGPTKIILLTTFRKQRNNERSGITRARVAASDCARLNP